MKHSRHPLFWRVDAARAGLVLGVVLLGLAASGRIGSKITTYSLDKADDAYTDLKAGKIEGRAVIVPFASV